MAASEVTALDSKIEPNLGQAFTEKVTALDSILKTGSSVENRPWWHCAPSLALLMIVPLEVAALTLDSMIGVDVVCASDLLSYRLAVAMSPPRPASCMK